LTTCSTSCLLWNTAAKASSENTPTAWSDQRNCSTAISSHPSDSLRRSHPGRFSVRPETSEFGGAGGPSSPSAPRRRPRSSSGSQTPPGGGVDLDDRRQAL
jgi:hypothetical protein